MRIFNKKKKPGWLAMSTSEQGTCVAHVLNDGNKKPKVLLAAIEKESLKDNNDCKILAANLNLSERHCSLLLNNGEYQLIQIEKPNVPNEELKQATYWKLKDAIDYPIDQATIDVINIPKDPSNNHRQANIYAATARNALIADYMQRLVDCADTDLEVIDIAELAQRNIATYLEQENRGLALLSLKESSGLLTFTSGGELYYSRSTDMGYMQIHNEVSSESKSASFERLSLDIQRSLDNFERNVPYVSINRLVLAPFPGREDFYDYLKTSLYVQVDRFDLPEIFDIDAVVDLGDLEFQAAILPVLGAALREAKS
ncbi:MAG: agglutinin biogenesis protein MshI [Methylotenera sp.]|nr:agglutinin biogenesis protein MshI [Methylotenera sp.]